jgi:hypothetical protein
MGLDTTDVVRRLAYVNETNSRHDEDLQSLALRR